MPRFHIRPGSTKLDDGLRLLKNFDSQLPWLATVGSADQWAHHSAVSQNPDHQAKYRGKVERSEKLWNEPFLTEGWTRVYIAEVTVAESELTEELAELAEDRWGQCGAESTNPWVVSLPVAAMVLENKSLDYTRSVLPEQDSADPFVYLSYLLTDRRTGSWSKGAGAALIDHAIDEARKLSVDRICGDCWRGNDRRLVKYYERQGFTAIGDFGVEPKEGIDIEQEWPGAVFEMRI